MKFFELLSKYEDETIIKRISYRYPNQRSSIDGYRKVLVQLRNAKIKKSKTIIDIEQRIEDKKKWFHVSGFENNEYYAIEFVSWNEWLGMKISEETLLDFKEIDILTHCLWEMTYMGFNQRTIQNTSNKLIKIRDEIIKDYTKRKDRIKYDD